MLGSVSEGDSSSHVAQSQSSVSLNVGKVISGRGVGHLFLHLLNVAGSSSVSLSDAMLSTLVVMVLI